MRKSTEPYENEWFYLKIYTGFRTSDHLLCNVLYPLWKKFEEEELAIQWFFIRYPDPEYHLRYRIKLDHRSSEKNVDLKIRESLCQFVEKGLVWSIEKSVYVPEYERYGKRGMLPAEQIFCADSSAVSKFLNLEKHLDENARWLFAISSINSLLSDFKCGLDEKKAILLDLSRKFGKEFGKDKSLARQLSERYRKYRGQIRNALTDEIPFADILSSRSVDHKNAVSAINNLYEKGNIAVQKQSLLESLIHMSLNRIFRNNNRLHEMVIYDLLFRAYKERFHRQLRK